MSSHSTNNRRQLPSDPSDANVNSRDVRFKASPKSSQNPLRQPVRSSSGDDDARRSPRKKANKLSGFFDQNEPASRDWDEASRGAYSTVSRMNKAKNRRSEKAANRSKASGKQVESYMDKLDGFLEQKACISREAVLADAPKRVSRRASEIDNRKGSLSGSNHPSPSSGTAPLSGSNSSRKSNHSTPRSGSSHNKTQSTPRAKSSVRARPSESITSNGLSISLSSSKSHTTPQSNSSSSSSSKNAYRGSLNPLDRDPSHLTAPSLCAPTKPTRKGSLLQPGDPNCVSLGDERRPKIARDRNSEASSVTRQRHSSRQRHRESSDSPAHCHTPSNRSTSRIRQSRSTIRARPSSSDDEIDSRAHSNASRDSDDTDGVRQRRKGTRISHESTESSKKSTTENHRDKSRARRRALSSDELKSSKHKNRVSRHSDERRDISRCSHSMDEIEDVIKPSADTGSDVKNSRRVRSNTQQVDSSVRALTAREDETGNRQRSETSSRCRATKSADAETNDIRSSHHSKDSKNSKKSKQDHIGRHDSRDGNFSKISSRQSRKGIRRTTSIRDERDRCAMDSKNASKSAADGKPGHERLKTSHLRRPVELNRKLTRTESQNSVNRPSTSHNRNSTTVDTNPRTNDKAPGRRLPKRTDSERSTSWRPPSSRKVLDGTHSMEMYGPYQDDGLDGSVAMDCAPKTPRRRSSVTTSCRRSSDSSITIRSSRIVEEDDGSSIESSDDVGFFADSQDAEEDCFDWYTWSTVRQSAAAIQRERKRLRESIANSLLYEAYESSRGV